MTKYSWLWAFAGLKSRGSEHRGATTRLPYRKLTKLGHPSWP
jgi:hypothetical protein